MALTFEDLHVLMDFGMCIVLWLVQLVIYPGFLRLKDDQLTAWHRVYTFRVSFIIMPLMLAQLGLAGWAAFGDPSVLNLGILVAVLACWALTFLVSVPLHNKLSRGSLSLPVREQLIRTNWPRTLLWSLIFVFGLMRNWVVS